MKLTIYHDGQYWVGVLEQQEQDQLKAAKWLFGTEPKDTEVLEFIFHQATELLDQTTHSLDHLMKSNSKRINPKRLARQVAKEMAERGVSTYAEQAMQKELEGKKRERNILNREQKKLIQQRKRELAIQKRKNKHRGK